MLFCDAQEFHVFKGSLRELKKRSLYSLDENITDVRVETFGHEMVNLVAQFPRLLNSSPP